MIFITRFMNSFLHQASFATGYWYYDRHRSVRLVILVGLAIDQIAQSGLSSLSVIYYSAQLFSKLDKNTIPSLYSSDDFRARSSHAIVESIFSRQCGRRSHYIVSLLKNSGTVLPSCAELPCTPASHLFHVLFVSPATLRRVHS